MLRSYLLVAGMAASVLGLVGLVNCGGGTDTNEGGSGTGAGTTGTTSGTSTGGGTTGTSNVPPTEPANGAAPDGTDSVTFAVSELFLGETKPDGTPDQTNGWKNYGYNLDGVISTATSTGLCKPRAGAQPKNVYPDGNGGADNSFGKNIMANIISSLEPAASAKATESIKSGGFTIMMDLQKLGSGANYKGMMAQLFAGADLGGPPKFDGSDVWPVRPELLKDGATIAGGSKVQFPMSYVADNTWVSGTKGDVTLSLAISGYSLDLAISSAWISFKMDPAHKEATSGVIAGVIPTDTLLAEIQKLAGSYNVDFCDPNNSTLQTIAVQLEQASDILKDGTQDPNKECDGISIGLGFNAKAVKLGAVAAATPPKDDPCK